MARDSLDQLLSKLNISATGVKDVALYEVIKELIKRVKELSNASGSSTTITNITQIQQFSDVFGGDSGGDGDIGPPGIRGVDGVAGATGAQGPPFPAFIYLEPEEAEQPLPIPGNTGPQGAAGATGAVGPPIGFISLEPDTPEDILPIPGKDGATSRWTLIATTSPNGSVAQYDYTGLSGYNEILVYAINVTKSASQTLDLRVSTDNGATFLAASGDYVSVTNAGVGTNVTAINLHTTAAALARNGFAIIRNFNDGSAPKWCHQITTPTFLISTTTALNAIRVMSSGGATLNAGTIYILGR